MNVRKIVSKKSPVLLSLFFVVVFFNLQILMMSRSTNQVTLRLRLTGSGYIKSLMVNRKINSLLMGNLKTR